MFNEIIKLRICDAAKLKFSSDNEVLYVLGIFAGLIFSSLFIFKYMSNFGNILCLVY